MLALVHSIRRYTSCHLSTSSREVNDVEIRNALEQANREISTRFDFKGSDARVEHKDKELTIYADDEFKLKQVTEGLLLGKLTKPASTSAR